MDEKRRFKATIAGKDYTIVGNRSATHLNTVVDLVNRQIEQLAELAPTLSVADRCVLMSVNAISDQLVKEQTIVDLEQKLELLESKLQAHSKKPVKQNKPAPVLEVDTVKPTIDPNRILPRSSAEGLIAGEAATSQNQQQHNNHETENDQQNSKFPFSR